MTDELTAPQRALIELAAAQRLQVIVNPTTKKLRGVRVVARLQKPPAIHAITVAAAMEMGLLKLGKKINPMTYYIDATPLGHARLGGGTSPRPLSVVEGS
jgi:hypothetical protein